MGLFSFLRQGRFQLHNSATGFQIFDADARHCCFVSVKLFDCSLLVAPISFSQLFFELFHDTSVLAGVLLVVLEAFVVLGHDLPKSFDLSTRIFQFLGDLLSGLLRRSIAQGS